MKRHVRREIRERLDSLIDRTSSTLIADPGADIRDDLGRIRAYAGLLRADRATDRGRTVAAALIGVTCLALIGGALAVRLPTATLTLAVEATSATFTLAEPWRWDTPAGGAQAVRFVGFELDLPSAIAAGMEPTAPDFVDFTTGRLSFALLAIDAGARVTLEASESGLGIFVNGGEVHGELTVSGPLAVAAGSLAEGSGAVPSAVALELPEIVGFAAQPTGVVPAELRIEPGAEALSLVGLPVRSLSFASERSADPGSLGFKSTIRAGRLVVSETGKEVPLGRGDHVEIAAAEAARLIEVALSAPDGDRRVGLDVAFEGRAGTVDIVRAGTRTDMRPTLLEYLYHNGDFVFVWSALGVLWALAWSARRTLL